MQPLDNRGKWTIWNHGLLKNLKHTAVTSLSQRSRLKSPTSRLFTQPFIETQIKENIKATRHWPLGGEFPAQRASYAENVSIWWRHHEQEAQYTVCILCGIDCMLPLASISQPSPPAHSMGSSFRLGVSGLTHWPLKDVEIIFSVFFKPFCYLMPSALHVKSVEGEYQITWANVD